MWETHFHKTVFYQGPHGAERKAMATSFIAVGANSSLLVRVERGQQANGSWKVSRQSSSIIGLSGKRLVEEPFAECAKCSLQTLSESPMLLIYCSPLLLARSYWKCFVAVYPEGINIWWSLETLPAFRDTVCLYVHVARCVGISCPCLVKRAAQVP